MRLSTRLPGIEPEPNAELSGRRRLYGACPFERRVRRRPRALRLAHRHGRCAGTLRTRTLQKDTTIRLSPDQGPGQALSGVEGPAARGRRTQPRCGLQREAASEEGQHGCRFPGTGHARHAAMHVMRKAPNACRRGRRCRQTDPATCGRHTHRKHDRPGSNGRQEAHEHGL